MFALTKIGSRNVWPSLRGHRLSALLVLVWSLAVLAVWLDHWNISTRLRDPSLVPGFVLYIPGLTDVGAMRWGAGLLFGSVPFLAGIVAAWWQLTAPETTSRFGSGLVAGMVAGVASMAALALDYWVAGVVNTAVFLAFGRLVALSWDSIEAMVALIIAVPGGALYGLLGGLVGGLAAMVSRRDRGSIATRRPA